MSKKPFPEFDKNRDWVGGKGVSRCVPEWIHGIYIGRCGYNHDKAYCKAKKSREECDADFRADLYSTLRNGGMWAWRAWLIARMFWRAVRVFGASHYDQGE